jgi:hypothetical protein
VYGSEELGFDSKHQQGKNGIGFFQLVYAPAIQFFSRVEKTESASV